MRLDAWLADPAAPSVMLVAGESGIGKTALVDWWLANLDGHSVVRTGCSASEGDTLAPFASLLVANGDDGDHSETLHEQFDHVVRSIAGSDPAVRLLVVDDAHRLSIESVALLRHLLWHHDLEDLRVVLVVAPPDAARNPALSRLLGDLVREGRSAELRVEGLDAGELDELLGQMHVQHSSAASLDGARLRRLTGGNPLFVTELLARPEPVDDLDDLDDIVGGGPLPAGVTAVLTRHLDGLARRTRRIVDVAARLGDGRTSRVAVAIGAGELEVIDALDEIGGGRLVDVDSIGGSYHFVHELARRAVVEASGSADSNEAAPPASP
jgi:hypothetical protein